MDHKTILKVLQDGIAAQQTDKPWILDNLLFLHVGGSRLYGTSSPSSDWDIRGVTLSPRSYWVGARKFEQIEIKTEELDIVVYDIRKWLSLAVRVNPNVSETLFVPPGENIIVQSELWSTIRQRTLPLISQIAYSGYHGYSKAQLHKMMTKQANKTGRRELAEEFSYDTKFAMHGFRLIRQGVELLCTGNITFPRDNADHLLSIRNGQVYQDSASCIADWEKQSKDLDNALHISILPERPDFEAYNDLLMSIFEHVQSDARHE